MIRVGMLWGERSLKFHLLSSNETSVEYTSRGLSFSGGMEGGVYLSPLVLKSSATSRRRR